MDLNHQHPEGHPDGPIPGDEDLRILEGFLEPDRIRAIIDNTQRMAISHLNSAELATNAGLTTVSLLNQLLSSIYLTSYYNSILQVGIAKRLEAMIEQFDRIMDSENDGWDGQSDVEPPEDSPNSQI